MSKGAKKGLGLIIIIILIVIVAYLIYGNTTKETNNSNTLNTVQRENSEELNTIENKTQNEIVNVIEEDEEVVNEEKTEPEIDNEEENEPTQESEVVSGNTLTREEKAVEYAKKYYEEEYGSSEGVNFANDGIREDGTYIVRSGTVEKPMYLIVNISTGEVTEK